MITTNQHVRLDVACYYRMSSDQQETSIEQQQKEVRRELTARGWKIVEEFVDAGKSGSKDVEKRVEFHRMIEESKKGRWKAIVCYDSSRFGRLDSLAAAPYKLKLRQAGVHLETIKEGRIDWTTGYGRMQDFMLSEANHEMARKIAGGTLRGRLAAVDAGFWPHGRIPFGYARQYIGPSGDVFATVKRSQRGYKPKGYRVRLVIDPEESEIVRWAFEQYANSDVSIRGLAKLLSEKCPPPAKGKAWAINGVSEMLSNQVYAGDTTIGVGRKGGRKGAFEQAPATQRATAPAIVPRALWDRVNRKMKDRRESGRRVHTGKAGALSGVLVCGHCGYRMVKKESRRGRFYVCASPQLRPHLGCRQWRVYESQIINPIIEKIVDALDHEIIRGAESKPAEAVKQDAATVAGQIAELDRRIEKGANNLLLADVDTFPMLQATLAEWRNERARLENTLRMLNTPTDERENYAKWFEGVRSRLVLLAAGGVLAGGQPSQKGLAMLAEMQRARPLKLDGKPLVVADVDTARELLHRIGCHVTLWWRPKGNGVHFTLDKGLLQAEFGRDSLDVSRSTPTRSRWSPDR